MIIFVMASAALAFVYPETLKLLWTTWDDTDYDGYVYILVAAYLIWRNGIYRVAEMKPGADTIILFALFSVSWLFGVVTATESASLVAVFFFFTALLTTMATPRKGPFLASSTLLFLIAIPFWDPFVYRLQDVATLMSTSMLSIVDLATYNIDNHVQVPNGIFHIDRGCSGYRYISASIALALLIIDQNRPRLPSALCIIAIGIIVAIIANGFRIATVIYIGNESNMQHPIVNDHATLGWILFALLVVPASVAGNSILSGYRTNSPVNEPIENFGSSHWPIYVSILSILLIAPKIAFLYLDEQNKQIKREMVAEIRLPSDLGVWEAIASDHDSVMEDYPMLFGEASTHLSARYSNGSQQVVVVMMLPRAAPDQYPGPPGDLVVDDHLANAHGYIERLDTSYWVWLYSRDSLVEGDFNLKILSFLNWMTIKPSLWMIFIAVLGTSDNVVDHETVSLFYRELTLTLGEKL